MVHIDAPSEPALHTNVPSTQPSHRLLLRRFMRLMATAMVLVSTVLLSGCIVLTLDGTAPGSGTESDSSTEGGSGADTSPPPAASHLPEPSVWRVDPPVLDVDAQKRLEEVEQFLWERYQAVGWQITATTQTFLGDIIDWVDPASVEGAFAEPPPPLTAEEMQLPDGVGLPMTELDVFPEVRGPEGTIPVMRPSFAAYVLGLTGATSLDDFIENYVVPGNPSGPDRLYAGIISEAPNLGANAWINAFNGWIDFGTMSLLEMAVGCRNLAPESKEMWQQVGIAASKDWANTPYINFGDSVLRIQVEFYTLGTDHRGPGKGGWEGTVTMGDFKPAAGARYAPGVAILTASTIGGPQFESSFQIRLWNGDWWVGWNGSWLGYYPGELFGDEFSSTLFSNACEVDWYGEVFDPDSAGTTWTWTDMGSGQFASTGWGNAASFRNPSYIDPSGIFQWPDVNKNVGPNNEACYTRTAFGSAPAPWDRFFFVGGPGGDAPNGDCPGLP